MTKHYTEEFKREAVAQVVDKDHSVSDVAESLGVSTKSIYDWKRLYGDKMKACNDDTPLPDTRRLKADLKRVTEERDILKKAVAYFAKGCL